MSVEIDHVVVCVEDLQHNPLPIPSVGGGRHPGHGTENRLIPLGSSYIELVAVVDRQEAAESEFGSWVQARAGKEGADALCLRTSQIDAMDPRPMSRVRPDGVTLSWKLAGLKEAMTQNLPFFIQWNDMSLHPGRGEPSSTHKLDSVTFSGDRQRLLQLTGGVPRLSYVDGPPAIEFRIADS